VDQTGSVVGRFVREEFLVVLTSCDAAGWSPRPYMAGVEECSGDRADTTWLLTFRSTVRDFCSGGERRPAWDVDGDQYIDLLHPGLEPGANPREDRLGRLSHEEQTRLRTSS
jgi:hypothetical protein